MKKSTLAQVPFCRTVIFQNGLNIQQLAQKATIPKNRMIPNGLPLVHKMYEPIIMLIILKTKLAIRVTYATLVNVFNSPSVNDTFCLTTKIISYPSFLSQAQTHFLRLLWYMPACIFLTIQSIFHQSRPTFSIDFFGDVCYNVDMRAL